MNENAEFVRIDPMELISESKPAVRVLHSSEEPL